MSFAPTNPKVQEIRDHILDLKYPSFQIYKEIMHLWKMEPVPNVAFLLPHLVDVGVRVRIPHYERIRPLTINPTERPTNTERKGRLVGLSANKDFFSFSVRIFDESVEVEEQDAPGSYRNFALLNLTGEVTSGWHDMEFDGDLEEEEIEILESLAFVCESNADLIYSEKYLLTKLALERFSEEGKWLFSEMKRLVQNGILPPPSAEGEYVREEGQPVDLEAWEMCFEPDLLNKGEFEPAKEMSLSSYDLLRICRNHLIYDYSPPLRWYTRAAEYAFAKYNNRQGWEPTQINGKPWFRHRLFPLRFRAYQKRTRVAPVYHGGGTSSAGVYSGGGTSSVAGYTSMNPSGPVGVQGFAYPASSSSSASSSASSSSETEAPEAPATQNPA